MPPCELVPKLADEGVYIGSESTIYRVLREEKMQNHRGRSEAPKRNHPTTYSADAPNQVWMWDITYPLCGEIDITLSSAFDKFLIYFKSM